MKESRCNGWIYIDLYSKLSEGYRGGLFYRGGICSLQCFNEKSLRAMPTDDDDDETFLIFHVIVIVRDVIVRPFVWKANGKPTSN